MSPSPRRPSAFQHGSVRHAAPAMHSPTPPLLYFSPLHSATATQRNTLRCLCLASSPGPYEPGAINVRIYGPLPRLSRQSRSTPCDTTA